MAWNEDLDALFVMFHDFTITHIEQQEDRITLRVNIPWGQMLRPPDHDYAITIVLAGSSGLYCEYWTLKTDPIDLSQHAAERECDEWSTSDAGTIATLGLEVQRYEHSPPDHYVLLSNSDRSINEAPIAGGHLHFHALAFMLYDANNKPLELAALQAWCKAWWDSIYAGREGT